MQKIIQLPTRASRFRLLFPPLCAALFLTLLGLLLPGICVYKRAGLPLLLLSVPAALAPILLANGLLITALGAYHTRFLWQENRLCGQALSFCPTLPQASFFGASPRMEKFDILLNDLVSVCADRGYLRLHTSQAVLSVYVGSGNAAALQKLLTQAAECAIMAAKR